MKRKIVLVGAYPPPYGGISVHVARLRDALKADHDVAVIDMYGTPQLEDEPYVSRYGPARSLNALRAIFELRDARDAIVHFHVTSLAAFLFVAYPMLAAVRRRNGVVLTIHSGGFVTAFTKGRAWRRWILRDLLRRFHHIVAVNAEQQAFLRSLGVDPARISLIPAYLPAIAAETDRVRAVWQSVGTCDRVLIASGACREYYGFHVILDALQESSAATGLVICVYSEPERAYAATLQSRISVNPLWHITDGLTAGEFAWLLQRGDAYIRATTHDGDAVAIREALSFGKSVIASDCVMRPAGVTLFRTGDSASLRTAIFRMQPMHLADPVAGGANAELTALRDVYAAVSAERESSPA